MTKIISQKEIEKVAKGIGIPNDTLQKALNFFPEINTIEEAQEAYYHKTSFNSQAQKAARKKWNKLSLIEAQKAKTIEEVRKAYYRAPPDSRAIKIACKKWNKLSLIEVEKSKNVEEAKKAYLETLNNSQAQKAALVKLYELYS
jgi:hypothetical protein